MNSCVDTLRHLRWTVRMVKMTMTNVRMVKKISKAAAARLGIGMPGGGSATSGGYASSLRAALQCCGPTGANPRHVRTIWEIMAPSVRELRALVCDGLQEDGRGGAMLGWLAPPGSPFRVQ